MRDRRVVLPRRGRHARDSGLPSMALGAELALAQQDANDDRGYQDQYPDKVLLAAAAQASNLTFEHLKDKPESSKQQHDDEQSLLAASMTCHWSYRK